MRLKWALVLSVILFSIVPLIPVYAEWMTQEHGVMGTRVSVSVWHDDAAIAKRAIDDVIAEMHRIDQTYSPYIETSELAQLNKLAALAPQSLSAEMKLLLESSAHISVLTNGAFDITFASVGHLYDYREQQQPSDNEIQEQKAAIDYRFVDIKNDTVFFRHPNVRIDLGGIAKGYAVDRAVSLLAKQGILHGSVSAGGDSRLLGDRLGRPWIVGIKNPRPSEGGNADDDVALRIPLNNAAISTSGDYERYFIDAETQERVHHIINPRSGKSTKGITSVTVIGDTGLEADPLSTGVFVLGVEKGLALINRLPNIDVIIIDQYGKVHYSDGLRP